MRALVVVFLMAAGCTGCGGGLPKEDVAHLVLAAKDSAAAYAHAKDAGAEGLLIEMAHCEIQAVARDQKLALYDGGVPCP